MRCSEKSFILYALTSTGCHKEKVKKRLEPALSKKSNGNIRREEIQSRVAVQGIKDG